MDHGSRSGNFGTSTIGWNTTPWVRSTLLNDTAVKLSTAKVSVLSDSVYCLGGRTAEYPRSVKSWKDKFAGLLNLQSIVNWTVMQNESCSSGKRYTGHTLQLLQEVRKTMGVNNNRMFNDLDWGHKGNKKIVQRIPQILLHTPRIFPKEVIPRTKI